MNFYSCMSATGRNTVVTDDIPKDESHLTTHETVSDENTSAILDVAIQILGGMQTTAEDAGIPDMSSHDKRFHGGRYNPDTMKCSLRERLAKADNVDLELGEHEKAISSISNGKMQTYLSLMAKKCPHIDPEEALEKIGAIQDRKLQGDAFRWLVKGAVRLPEDMYKVRDARVLSEKAKKDPFSYSTPQECINELQGMFKNGSNTSQTRINPDSVPELSDKKEFPYGVTTYLVKDDQSGQQAMRKIIDSHWGRDANPWCLLARDEDEDNQDEEFNERFRDWWNGLSLKEQKDVLVSEGYDQNEIDGYVEDDCIYLSNIDPQAAENYYIKNIDKSLNSKDNSLRSAWGYWNTYNALPKRVAFKDGRLLAFMATDAEDGGEVFDYINELYQDGGFDRFMDEYDEDDMNMLSGAPAFPDWLKWKHNDVYQEYVKEQWWDRDDRPHEGIPLGNIPVPDDSFDRWANFEIRDGKLKQVGGYQKMENGRKVKEWNADGSVSMDRESIAQDDANFLNYQYDQKDSRKTPKPIPSEQKPAPKKLNDAISKRTDSPAVRYINMVNKKETK